MFDFGGILAAVITGLQDVFVNGILGLFTSLLSGVLPGVFPPA